MQVFRIVQEALTNIARHANAKSARLALAYQGGGLELRLSDDGCGIDSVPRRPGSIGLFSMAERAREIGASLDVRRRLEGGTELALTLPPPAACQKAAG